MNRKTKSIDFLSGEPITIEFETVTTALIQHGEKQAVGSVTLGPKDTFVRSKGNKLALARALKMIFCREDRKLIWPLLFESGIVVKEVRGGRALEGELRKWVRALTGLVGEDKPSGGLPRVSLRKRLHS